MSKPSVLVLGGVGSIGRNLVTYIIEKDLASSVRVVDKVLPQTAFLSAKDQAALDKAEYKQANLVNPPAIAGVFEKDGKSFDIVFNCAGETKYGQNDEVYNERVTILSTNCAKEAAKQNVKMFIQLSTAQIYEHDKKASNESSKVKPWTGLATASLKAEEELAKIDGLNYLIVRPAMVYGPSDVASITPRLIIGAVYKHIGDEMKFLWSKDLKLNTVHVRDVVKALWHLSEKGTKGEVYNLADKGDTTQDTISQFIGEIYGIKTGYQGMVVNNFAKVNLTGVTEEVNDKHLQPWSEICNQKGVSRTNLTPYLDKELLANHPLCVDGTKIESTGFTYDHPNVTKELLEEVLKGYIELKTFPDGFF